MEIIDTHTHLYLEQFEDDFDEVMERSFKCGVKKFVFPSISSKYNKRMIKAYSKYPSNIFLNCSTIIYKWATYSRIAAHYLGYV